MKTFCVVFVALLMVSCAPYQKISMEELVPGTYNLGQGKNVAFWVRRQSFESDTSNFYYNIDGLSPDELSITLYAGVNDAFKSNGVTDSVYLYMDGVSRLLPDSVQPLPSDLRILKQAVQGIVYDYIFVLESVDYQKYDKEKNDMRTKSLVRLYDAKKEQLLCSDTIKNFLTLDMVLYGDYAYALQRIYMDGLRYATALTPHWMTSERRLYTGSRLLNYGNCLVLQESYNEALKVYENDKENAKALLNMSYIKELQGDFISAKQYVSEASAACKDKKNIQKYCTEYVKKLTERERIINALKNQE